MGVRVVVTLLWGAWLYPFVFRAPHGQKRESITVATPTRVGLVFEVAAIALAAIVPGLDMPGWERIVPAVALAALAIWIAFSAVKHLGRQFRLHAGLYADHELVRTGAYAIVRHPIYASLLAMLLCTMLLLTPWIWMPAPLALFLIGTEIRVRCEDGLLASRFGAQFEDYRKRVPAYLPFVR